MTVKRLLRHAALLCLCALPAVLSAFAPGISAARRYPDHDSRFFVSDFAGVLDDADEQTVYAAGVRLQKATGAQVVLVTVQSLNGDTLEDYAYGLATQWGIGEAGKDNGLLLLFTAEGPHSRIEVGSGLEGALPDSKAGRILDAYLVPWYDDEDSWSAQLTETYQAMVNVVYDEYGLTDQKEQVEERDTDDKALPDIVTVIAVIVIVMLVFGRRRGGGFWPGVFLGGMGRGGGGSFGGRSGGGFSGGGGGFSGGGASR